MATMGRTVLVRYRTGDAVMDHDVERIGALLELALYGRVDARSPRDPLLLAEEAFERICKLEAIRAKLLELAGSLL